MEHGSYCYCYCYLVHMPESLVEDIEQDLGRENHDMSELGDLGPECLLELLGIACATEFHHFGVAKVSDDGCLLPHQGDVVDDKKVEFALKFINKTKHRVRSSRVKVNRTVQVCLLTGPSRYSFSLCIISLTSMAATSVLPVPVSITAIVFSASARSNILTWYDRGESTLL